jgi:hypothetical protein
MALADWRLLTVLKFDLDFLGSTQLFTQAMAIHSSLNRSDQDS